MYDMGGMLFVRVDIGLWYRYSGPECRGVLVSALRGRPFGYGDLVEVRGRRVVVQRRNRTHSRWAVQRLERARKIEKSENKSSSQGNVFSLREQ